MRIVSMAVTGYQHLTTEAIAWLEDAAQEVADGKACHHVSRTAFGWIAYCDEENAGGTIPAEVFATMQAARARGAEYVMMDEAGDAEPEPIELPPFPQARAAAMAGPITGSLSAACPMTGWPNPQRCPECGQEAGKGCPKQLNAEGRANG